MNAYTGFKFAHILVAIVALGTGAAVGILLGFFADEPTHGEFVLRISRRLLHFVVLPGYVLMLATGMWMGHLGDLLDVRWTEAAMNLWGVGALFLALMLLALRKGAVRWGRWSGSGAALVVLAILYFMTFKPG